VDRSLAGIFWILLYLGIVTVPILLMLVPPVPSGRGFWLELSVALGFAGLTQIGLQFLLIARFKRVTAPYGIDIILKYHRQIAVVAVAAIVLHPLILVMDNPSRLKLLNPLQGNWASRSALMATAVLLATVVLSIWREKLKLDYGPWRLTHILLGVSAIVFAQLHASMAGLYINTTWKQAVWIVMALLMVSFVAYLRLVKPVLQRRDHWRVVETRKERGDTTTLVLEPVDHEGFTFLPGQFAWIKVADSPFTIEEHPFSFSSSAHQPRRIEFGIKALGDFSSSIPQIPAGTRVYVDGPHGAFSMDRYEAPGYVFLAGGVGITPIMSMLRTMADRRDPRPVTLFYADKKWDNVAFREALEELGSRLDLDVIYVLEEPPEDWEGEKGMVTPDLLERRLPRDDFVRDYMICGPPPMMDAVHQGLLKRGIPNDRIQLERFALA
jgi:predicted ferric reductase